MTNINNINILFLLTFIGYVTRYFYWDAMNGDKDLIYIEGLSSLCFEDVEPVSTTPQTPLLPPAQFALSSGPAASVSVHYSHFAFCCDD
jgi:hypothetical protein